MSDIRFTDEIPNPRQYLELFETTEWNHVYNLDLSEISELLERSWYIVSAYYKQQLIGIGRLVSDGVLYAMIYDMIVDPSFQNRGIGTIILEKLVGRCKARGIRDIQLFSAAGRSSFYAKRGFIKRPANSPGMKYNDR